MQTTEEIFLLFSSSPNLSGDGSFEYLGSSEYDTVVNHQTVYYFQR